MPLFTLDSEAPCVKIMTCSCSFFYFSKERWFIEWENGGGVCVRLER